MQSCARLQDLLSLAVYIDYKCPALYPVLDLFAAGRPRSPPNRDGWTSRRMSHQSRVNQRNFCRRTGPAPGCTAVLGRKVNKCTLRCPLACAKVNSTRVRNHGEIHGWDGSAEGGARHGAERTGLVPVRRDVLVIIHKLAEDLFHFGSRVLKCRQEVPPFESSLLEYARLTPHSFDFCVQIGCP